MTIGTKVKMRSRLADRVLDALMLASMGMGGYILFRLIEHMARNEAYNALLRP